MLIYMHVFRPKTTETGGYLHFICTLWAFVQVCDALSQPVCDEFIEFKQSVGENAWKCVPCTRCAPGYYFSAELGICVRNSSIRHTAVKTTVKAFLRQPKSQVSGFINETSKPKSESSGLISNAVIDKPEAKDVKVNERVPHVVTIDSPNRIEIATLIMKKLKLNSVDFLDSEYFMHDQERPSRRSDRHLPRSPQSEKRTSDDDDSTDIIVTEIQPPLGQCHLHLCQ
ncbi:uncharacterized protein LOC106180328 [Lingula anatina]|uniref:Uncharacterized protein LOC106180328 n=1 Tax=Lingula anatina TaxID=7574 RepID=A0A1S3KB76_LINAN|nr:uncharacterized protein LOC106180328 [Lingula anatina]|eukprot:XP_013419742.1 uncharacterized protein LOC106180328 [Lingula anatina]